MGGSLPGAKLTDEGMGLSYQAFCIAQSGLSPWPFGAVEEEPGEAGGESAGPAPTPQQEGQQQQGAGSGSATQQQQQQLDTDK